MSMGRSDGKVEGRGRLLREMMIEDFQGGTVFDGSRSWQLYWQSTCSSSDGSS